MVPIISLDLHHLLRLLPLLSSTAMLTYSYSERLFLTNLLNSNITPPSYLPRLATCSYLLRFALGMVCIFSSLASVYMEGSFFARNILYFARQVFVCGDFALSTRALSKLERIKRDENIKGGLKRGDAVAYNNWRAAGIVAPAWLCFMLAVVMVDT